MTGSRLARTAHAGIVLIIDAAAIAGLAGERRGRGIACGVCPKLGRSGWPCATGLACSGFSWLWSGACRVVCGDDIGEAGLDVGGLLLLLACFLGGSFVLFGAHEGSFRG